MPCPEEANGSAKPRLQEKQHPAFLFPTKLQLLEPPLPPPQNKLLPVIPTQARLSAWNPPNTTRKAIANYSLFPKLAVIPPPRGSSLQHLSRTGPHIVLT
jgi:hypothetical protein